MPTLQKVIAGGVAGLALMVSAGAVLAYPGEAGGAVNVRSGPGGSGHDGRRVVPMDIVDNHRRG